MTSNGTPDKSSGKKAIRKPSDRSKSQTGQFENEKKLRSDLLISEQEAKFDRGGEKSTEKYVDRNFDKEALEYHRMGKPGKIEVHSSKPCSTEKALSLAYSPGVAAPCKEIARDSSLVYEYTAKGNLVAVISNGTAVLGLGDIGPLASKPVMEGKGILFKQFAGIDVFDIEINTRDVESTVAAIKALEPTFGGINLEDIKAPECFEIEERLKKEMKIPVFHDDQHGTAIISGAALLNACDITKRKMEKIKVVMNGAGAASISCAKIFIALGVKKENILMCDSSGVIYKGRKEGMNKYKEFFAIETPARTLSDALVGADVFIGLSVAGALTPEMIMPMAKDPLIFAMANPDPEILPAKARAARPDAIIATGRSDYPNQVNNVLGFPSIFRGALDTRSTQINEEMKLAAVHSLAQLTREDVPDRVSAAYGGKSFKYGREYLIPKPFDPRVLLWVAPAVAKAAMKSGVAQKKIENFDDYRDRLESIQGPSRVFIRSAIHKIKFNIESNNGQYSRILFPESTNSRILRALKIIIDEDICRPVLVGNRQRIIDKLTALDMPELLKLEIIEPFLDSRYQSYAEELHRRRARKGIQRAEAERILSDPNYYAAMMVEMGDADGMVNGAAQNYSDAVRPILQIIGTSKGGIASGLNFMLLEDRFILLADTAVNFNPSPEDLSKIALQAAKVCEYFEVKPQIAMLSFSNFTNAPGTPAKMRKAAQLVKAARPELIVDGDMQADTAVNPSIQKMIFPFCELEDGANILLFPNLESGNITYKLLQQLGKGEVIGPFLMGVRHAANVLQRTTTVDSIFNCVVLTTLESQYLKDHRKGRTITAE